MLDARSNNGDCINALRSSLGSSSTIDTILVVIVFRNASTAALLASSWASSKSIIAFVIRLLPFIFFRTSNFAVTMADTASIVAFIVSNPASCRPWPTVCMLFRNCSLAASSFVIFERELRDAAIVRKLCERKGRRSPSTSAYSEEILLRTNGTLMTPEVCLSLYIFYPYAITP